MHIKRLAKQIAVQAKLHNITDGDFGPLYPEEYAMTDAEWMAVCDEAERLLPTVEPTMEQRAAFSAAMRGFSTTDAIYSDA